jgi:hypothetical protein
MALPGTQQQREYQNFTDNGDGTTSRFVNVVNPISVEIDTTGLATEATLQEVNDKLNDGSQKTQIVDSTGEIVEVKALGTQVVSGDKGLVVNSVIHGLTTGGGGGYVDVKVNPSGALTVESTVTSSALPSGAATSANQTTANASLASIDSKLTAPLSVTGPLTDAQLRATPVPVSAGQSGTWNINNITGTVSLPTGASTSANQVTANASLASIDAGIPAALGQTTMANSMPVVIASDQTPVTAGIYFTNNYAPSAPYNNGVQTNLRADPDGQLLIRGDILTDEGTFRDDFSGANLSNQRWTSASTGNSSISVAASNVTLASGTGSANRVSITATGDYGPISARSMFSVSQRIANQEIRFGFADNTASPSIYAFFKFTGTDNTVVICESSSSVAVSDTQSTTVKIPNGTSATSNDYYIEVQPDQVSFIINGFVVANHRTHIPGPYDELNVSAIIQNSAIVTTTSLVIDYVYFINQNSLQVNNSFRGDPVPTSVSQQTAVTYGASVTGLVMANTPTDVFTITGSATKTVRIKRISLDGTQTTATHRVVQLIKRSTANTAGTSTTRTAVSFDSTSAAATATVLAYTANPTTGTAVGTLHSELLFIGTTTSAVEDKFVFETMKNGLAQEIILRGTNEVLAINMNAVTSAGNSMNASIVWTEE